MALHIIEKAEKAGLLRPGGTIVENTSGNTGVGRRHAGRGEGVPLHLHHAGQDVEGEAGHLEGLRRPGGGTPTNVPADSPDSYYSVAKRIAAETPDSFYLNQYHNPDNVEAHYQLTGPEIWEQTGGTDRRLRGRHRHRRHDVAAAAGTSRRRTPPSATWAWTRSARSTSPCSRPGSSPAARLQGGGHRRGHDVRGHGPQGARRRAPGDRRRVLRDGAAPGPRGGDLRRRLLGRGGARGGAGGARAGARARWWWCRCPTRPRATSPSSTRTSGCATTASRSRAAGALSTATVRDVLGRRRGEVITARRTDKVEAVVKKMKEHDISQMPVLDEAGKVTGMIHEYDLLNFLIEGKHRALGGGRAAHPAGPGPGHPRHAGGAAARHLQRRQRGRGEGGRQGHRHPDQDRPDRVPRGRSSMRVVRGRAMATAPASRPWPSTPGSSPTPPPAR